MAARPEVPSWMRTYRLDGYVNIYELLPDEPRIYGTESLFGDWGGEILVLAKDFAPSAYILDQMSRGCSDPYRHSTEFRTNRTLSEWLRPCLRAKEPAASCGVLYGSALAGLLRNDGKRSGSLVNRTEALVYGGRVLRYVIDHMPHLRVIVCMGSEARACFERCYDAKLEANLQSVNVGSSSSHRLVLTLATYHPASYVSNKQKAAPWGHVYATMNRKEELT